VTGNGEDDCVLLQVDEAYDLVDGDLTGDAIVWHDVMDGSVLREFTGREVEACEFDTLLNNDTPHVIRVTATNSRGESRSASRTIYVMQMEGGPG
jgi:hypothetical protein